MLTYSQITDLQNEIEATIKELKLDQKQSRLGELQTESMREDLWQNPDNARKVLSEIESLQTEINTANELQTNISTLKELFESSDTTSQEELLPEFEKLNQQYSEFQTLKFLSNKYDDADAILSIHSGQGGTEANDWTDMLFRMYKMYFEKQGWSYNIEHMVSGNEAGISTVTLLVKGRYAFGKLKKEQGTHRLVRISPFNAQGLRQTSFAGVEVMPVIDESDNEIVIPESDLEFKAVRSGGAGGQHVNKTSSAVQLTHIPTGISVHNSQERSQAQNREAAMRILKAKLWQIEQEKRDQELAKLKGEHKTAGWGNQIRNYVLHPYKLVKDLRTGVESNEPDKVLAGQLDEFIEAEIRLS